MHAPLLYGQRAPKSHPRIPALGAVDELNAALGLLRVHAARPLTRDTCARVQPWLIELMGELATPPGFEERYARSHPRSLGPGEVAWLDGTAAQLEARGALQFEGWAIPGAAGSLPGAHADAARTVCRRAERHLAGLADTPDALPNPDILRFLNRLSDLLWLLARWEELPGGQGDSGASDQ